MRTLFPALQCLKIYLVLVSRVTTEEVTYNNMYQISEIINGQLVLCIKSRKEIFIFVLLFYRLKEASDLCYTDLSPWTSEVERSPTSVSQPVTTPHLIKVKEESLLWVMTQQGKQRYVDKNE